MRKGMARLLLLVIIALAAYSLNKQLDLFPEIAKPDAPVVQTAEGEQVTLHKLESSSSEAERPYGELELDLAAGFKERSERFSVSYTGDKQKLSDNMTNIIRESLKHDDYSAYILESYIYTIRSWGNKSTIAVEASYRETPEQTAEVDRITGEAMAEIIKPNMNDHEKVKAIHDWIVTHVEYDQSLSYYTAYNAVSLGKAVCQGYTLLGYRMLDKAGIPVLIAEGSVNTGEHAWNMVQLDGIWYHLDLTWDDPVGVQDDRIRYTYYLKTDEELRADHQWTRTYPEAVVSYADTIETLVQKSGETEALRYNRLKLSLGLHWLDQEHTVASGEQLRDKIRAAVNSSSTNLEFRYMDGNAFPEALKAAFEDIGVAVGYRASYEKFASDDSLLVNIHLSYQ